jgi:hypothetical protein
MTTPTKRPFIYEFLLYYNGPAKVFHSRCTPCPLQLACHAKSVLTTTESIQIATCPRCWCVFIYILRTRQTCVCTRLRDGIHSRIRISDALLDHPSATYVGTALGYYARDVWEWKPCKVFPPNLTIPTHKITSIGCTSKHKKLIGPTYIGLTRWNSEHPRNLCSKTGKYLGGPYNSHYHYYNDNNIKVDPKDCVDLIKRNAPYGVVIS